MVDREAEQRAREICSVRLTLLVADRSDLGPDGSPVGDVVVGEGFGPGVGRELAVPRQQPSGKRGSAEAFEIHGEKRNVVEHVAPPQLVRELDAVEDARSVGEHEDVVRLQVAVAVSDPAGCDSLLEEIVASVEIPAHELFGAVELLTTEQRIAASLELREALSPQLGDVVGRPDVTPGPLGGLRVVQPGEITRDLPHGVIDVVAPSDAQAQPPVRRHPAHHHDVVAGIAIRSDHVGDPEVHVRCETPIQFDLAMSSLATGSDRREVEEAQIDRLLHLEGTITEEHDDGRMRLGQRGRLTHPEGWDQSPW